MTRYHPLLVALHWLLALMIVLALIVGTLVLEPLSNSDPAKIGSLQAHMTIGLLILSLMLIRLVIRVRTQHPPTADIGNGTINRLSRMAHWVLYLGVFGMVASGITLSIAAGLPDIVFGGSGTPLPADFDAFTPRIVHGLIAPLLGFLILGHIAAALYHQFVRRDGLFRRMWFGNRTR